jgi:hypothetical protein
MKTFSRFALIVVLTALSFLPIRTQTINAASCNLSDVQSAFNSVTASTTIVSIPAGICDWTGQITWAIPLGEHDALHLRCGKSHD